MDEDFGNKTDRHDKTPHRELSSKNVRLHCCNIWFPSQSPWSFDNALNKSYECLFSVVQSTAGVSPGRIYSAWEEHLVNRELLEGSYREQEESRIH